MTVYYLTYVFLIVINLIISKLNIDVKKQRSVFCIFFFIAITCVLGLRHQCMGIDLGYGYNSGYLSSFDNINAFSWSEIFKLEQYLNYEKGFILFNKIIGSIYNDRQFFLVSCAFVSFLPIALYINRKSDMPLLSAVIYLGLPAFMICYSGLRQGISIGITVLSMKFIEEKKVIPFALTVLLAMQFHYSAIVFFVAYPLYYIRLNDTQKVVCVILVPIIYMFRESIFTFLSKILKENATTGETGAFTFFAVLFLIYIFLILFKNDDDDDDESNGTINLFYVAVICQSFGGIHMLAQRVAYYFMIYAAVAIPTTLSKFKDRNERNMMYIFVILAFIIFGLWCIKRNEWAMSYPYYAFWSEEVFW